MNWQEILGPEFSKAAYICLESFDLLSSKQGSIQYYFSFSSQLQYCSAIKCADDGLTVRLLLDIEATAEWLITLQKFWSLI